METAGHRNLQFAEKYMSELNREAQNLEKIKLNDKKVKEYINTLIPVSDDMTIQQKKNIYNLRENLQQRYFDAPDLLDTGKTGYRFINAVSDFATHNQPLRMTSKYQENLFMRTMNGNDLVDNAYRMLKSA